jgi:dUTP pyrophosphatase
MISDIEPTRMKNAHPACEVSFKLLHPLWRETPPCYATAASAGLDLRACIETDVVRVGPGERIGVPSGLAMEIHTPGVAGFVFSRSGLGATKGLTVAQGVGVIDPDYRGEIQVWLLNTSDAVREIARGQRVAQLLFLPFYMAEFAVVSELGETARAGGGFGHTGNE